ncbi:hypothetical protein RJT34_29561 [Clitoria ternatea]|uniref:Uncharacterized protein n=1 Tax=Clitoria ternatea TaxID=43366 RepID=A0AAN9FED7_CLITE
MYKCIIFRIQLSTQSPILLFELMCYEYLIEIIVYAMDSGCCKFLFSSCDVNTVHQNQHGDPHVDRGLLGVERLHWKVQSSFCNFVGYMLL